VRKAAREKVASRQTSKHGSTHPYDVGGTNPTAANAASVDDRRDALPTRSKSEHSVKLSLNGSVNEFERDKGAPPLNVTAVKPSEKELERDSGAPPLDSTAVNPSVKELERDRGTRPPDGAVVNPSENELERDKGTRPPEDGPALKPSVKELERDRGTRPPDGAVVNPSVNELDRDRGVRPSIDPHVDEDPSADTRALKKQQQKNITRKQLVKGQSEHMLI
jgi:hypothetical protein